MSSIYCHKDKVPLVILQDYRSLCNSLKLIQGPEAALAFKEKEIKQSRVEKVLSPLPVGLLVS